MGRFGSALDNAAESFNSTLEFELLSRRRFAIKAGARREAAFTDRYDRVRRHNSCEMHSRVDYEAILAARALEAAEGEKAV